MSTTTDIAIIGAGPYGLSIAAYLGARGADHRIVGKPMHAWLANMPQGMHLKSAGFASNLYEPSGTFTLEKYCRNEGIAYRPVDFPVQLKTFCDYGIEFQQRFVPNLENETLTNFSIDEKSYRLQLGNGTSFRARRVIVATGLDYFRYIPEQLSGLPADLLTHSGDHHDPTKFNGQQILILGGGASAVDMAVLLREAGAKVQQIIRSDGVEFGEAWVGPDRSLFRRLQTPVSGLGPGWKNQTFVSLPWLFRYLPDSTRVRQARNCLGPSGGWFMRERAASIPVLTNKHVKKAEAGENHVRLYLDDPKRGITSIDANHVIAATGYRVDLRRLPFLDSEISRQLKLVAGSPVLSANFESSVDGLYFVGPMAATAFGPLMRFALGADFTSRRISSHLLTRASK